MSRLGGVRNNVGGGGGAVGGRGGDAARVQLKDLPIELQHAHEMLEALRNQNEVALRARVVSTAGATEPVGANGLRLVAELYGNLGMPLSVAGVQRFKQDRGLVGGTSLAGPAAKAYARALDGNEILVRVDRREESTLRPSEKACLQFLREFARRLGADELKPVKDALGLGNPKVPPAALALMNEYVGLTTVKEISRATTMREIALTRDAMRELAAQLAAEKAK